VLVKVCAVKNWCVFVLGHLLLALDAPTVRGDPCRKFFSEP
jgi:hypothetical protein